MAYIGKTPTVGNFQICDAISVVNNQAAYTMQVGSVNVSPESANHMIVSLNGVIQKPTDAFTVSGSTITFASNLVTGDVINFIQILGNVLDLGVPSDNTVTTAKIVDGAVTSAKLASGVGGVAGITSSADATAMTITSAEKIGIGETSPLGLVHIKTADSGAGANGDADELIIENGTSGASAGISILSATGTKNSTTFLRGDNTFNAPPLGGITMAHQWRVNTSFTGEAVPIASNWEQVDTDGYGGIGSVMSQSSGIFTFPETGIYYISFGVNSTLNGNDRAVGSFIQTTTDNSSYSTASQGTTFINTPGSVAYANAFMDFMFDVTNVSTHKCRFGVSNVNSSTQTDGSTAQNATYATFIRLGDT